MSRPRSLQGRLLALVVGVVACGWIAVAVITWLDVRHELDELLDSHLAQAAALLVAQQAREIGDGEHDLDAPSLHRYSSKAAFQVFHEGRLALRSAGAPDTPLVPRSEHFTSGFTTVRIGGRDWRVFAAHGADRDVQVYVGEQARSRSEIAGAVMRSMLAPMAIALPLLALAAGWAVHRGMAPLRRLGRVLAERRPDALDPVPPDGTVAEMVPMVDALNGLFRRIAALLESERRFTADAAHELRTPIAAIRAQAQVALAEDQPQERRRALERTVEGCDRATRLVEQLLTLSRLEAAAAPALGPVDLGAVAQRVAADLAPRALARGQSLELDAEPGCTIEGRETLLEVLVRNLVDNAIRYSPSGARVKIAVRREAGRPLLSVEDGGPGMPEADRARLGERFFRQLGNDESGSGLGWSIVRRVAAVHGLRVEVGASETLGGLAVRIGG